MTDEQQLARFTECQLNLKTTSSLFDECKSGDYYITTRRH